MAAMRGPVGAAAGAAAAFAVVALVDPNQPGHYPTCPFLWLTGYDCPGCGSLRAMHALSRGDLGTAVGLNGLTMAVLPVLAFIWLRWARRSWAGAPRPRLAHPAYLWAFLAVVVAFGVVRNLPFGAALAP
jgi:uncharacterized protein DUF2752